MKISFSPVGVFKALVVERPSVSQLRVNGELFNFDPLGDGDIIPSGAIPCEWFIGPVENIDGEIQLSLRLPHGTNPDAHVAFPAPIIDPPLGVVDLPFSTWYETSESPVEGGVEITTTTHRWQQADQLSVEFIPEQISETPEEHDNVDA